MTERISDERIKYLVRDCGEEGYRELTDEEERWFSDVINLLEELLTLRQQNAKWKASVKKRETYITKLEMQNAELIENSERLAEDVVWCGGSDDFSLDGKAHVGYKKVMEDVEQHTALMARIKEAR